MFGSDPAMLSKFDESKEIEIVRKIASGGMGAVYEALAYGSNGFRKRIALKTILERYSQDGEFVGLFIGEAKLVADLVHQNIVQMYHLGKLESMYFMTMEYVNGINFQEFMNKHVELGIQLPIDLGVYIISRACRGLEYAHNKRDANGNLLGVVHRDVSPKNIMISSEGEIKITDFGIAKAFNLMRDQEGEILMGKAQYMSPEQAQFMTTDRRSDIFSLGVVMFELLTGQQPFECDDTTMTLQEVVYKKLPNPAWLNPDIPENIEKIILKATAKDVEKRYQSGGAMAYDLEYSIYSRGYGPTIVTMERYLRKYFPDLYKTDPGPPTRDRGLFEDPDKTKIMKIPTYPESS